MIKTLTPYANTAKTAEIMSRYRPIAPKPEAGPTSPTGSGGGGDSSSSSAAASTSPSPKIKQSPYLRNLWPQMQARPTRTRKRGSRAALSPPTCSLKRRRTIPGPTLGLSPPPCHVAFMGFSSHPHPHQQISINPNLAFEFNKPCTSTTSLVTLPLLPNADLDNNNNKNWPINESTTTTITTTTTTPIDLNKVAAQEIINIPEEKNLLQQLQVRLAVDTPCKPPVPRTLIAPQPIRPVGSTIRVRSISDILPDPKPPSPLKIMKRPEEVEAEVESESLPAVISDSNNKVRMANSAYKELVGQPECAWLGSMVASSSCKRIGGEVVLRLADAGSSLPAATSGFSCWVRIEWGGDGGNKKVNSVNAFCDVNRLACDQSKDYVFTWRFHTNEPSKASTCCNNVAN